MGAIHEDVLYFFRTRGLSLLVYGLPAIVPISIWQGYVNGQRASLPALHSGGMPPQLSAGVMLPSLVAGLIYTGLMMILIDTYSRGLQPNLRSLWAQAIHRGPYLFAVQVLLGIASFLAAIPLIIPGFYVAGRLLDVQVQAPLSEAGVWAMMRQSWRETQGYGWSLIGGYALWLLLPLSVGILLQALISHLLPAHGPLTWAMLSLSYALSMFLDLPSWVFLYRHRQLRAAQGVR